MTSSTGFDMSRINGLVGFPEERFDPQPPTDCTWDHLALLTPREFVCFMQYAQGQTAEIVTVYQTRHVGTVLPFRGSEFGGKEPGLILNPPGNGRSQSFLSCEIADVRQWGGI